MLLEKPLPLPTKISPWFTSVFSKSVQQFQKSVQPELKPVQPVSALFPYVTFWPASLPVNPVRKSRVQPDFGPAQPDLGPVESPTESPSEPKTPWWKPVQPVFSQLFPTATNFWGILYIPLTLSLRSLLPSPRILGWPTLKQEHSIHLSHPKSHLLQFFEGPLVWGEVDLTRCWFHLYSPFLFISRAHRKLESCADLLLLEPWVPWRIEVTWESPNLWTTPRSLYHPLVELIWEEIALTLVVGLWRIRVGKDLALCGLLNKE
jgi:hypothetical protein